MHIAFNFNSKIDFHEILWFDMYVYQHNIVNSNVVKYY